MSKSVFFVTLPKSGTTNTWNVCSESMGVPIPERLKGPAVGRRMNTGRCNFEGGWAVGDFVSQTINPENFSKQVGAAEIFGGHLPASSHNIQMLEESGLERLFLLIRDPRDATVSWAHHVRSYGPEHRKHISKFCHLPNGYYDWSDGEQLSFLVRTHLPQAVNWLESWLDYLASADRSIDILLLYFDQLKRMPMEYFQSISSFLRLPIDLSKVPQPKAGVMHYRKGSHRQWRDEFSEQDLQFSELLLGTRLEKAYARAARGVAERRGLLTALDCREETAASHLVVEMVCMFPNDKWLLEIVSELFPGIDIPVIAHTSDLFLYREKLLEQLRRRTGS